MLWGVPHKSEMLARPTSTAEHKLHATSVNREDIVPFRIASLAVALMRVSVSPSATVRNGAWRCVGLERTAEVDMNALKISAPTRFAVQILRRTNEAEALSCYLAPIYGDGMCQ